MASVRVPPRLLSPGIDAVRGAGATRWIAQHGIGIIEAGWPELDAGTFGELRRSIEHLSGATVVRRSGDDLDDVDPWGASPDAIVIQRRLKGLFDPASVCNPGKLPGGL